MASLLSPIGSGFRGRTTLAERNRLDRERNLQLNAQSRARRTQSNVGAFQVQSPQSIQQSLKAQLAGIQGAQQQARAGFNQSASLLRQGTQQGIGALQQGQTDALASLQAGQQQAVQALAPVRETTIGALERFSALTGISGDGASATAALRADPGFQFRLEEGLRATERLQSARGIGGGRALIELQERGEGLAAAELSNAVNRLTNIIGLGLPAIQQEASIAADTARAAADLQTSTASQTASLLASQGGQLAGLRTQLAGDLADASLASAGARSQAALARGSSLKVLQQRLGSNNITSTNVSLGG